MKSVNVSLVILSFDILVNSYKQLRMEAIYCTFNTHNIAYLSIGNQPAKIVRGFGFVDCEKGAPECRARFIAYLVEAEIRAEIHW